MNKLRLVIGMLLTFSLNLGNVCAQDAITRYLQAANDYAWIYAGELEEIYSPNIYRNQPYFQDDDYTKGDVTFQDNLYRGQTLRLDLYRDRLIVVSPKKRTGVYLSGKNVQRVYLHTATFLYLSSPNPYNLEEGYYQLIAENSYFKLLARKSHTLHYKSANYYVEDNIKDKRNVYFSYHWKYYLVNGVKTVQVKKWNTFAKYFPEIRSELKEYIHNQRLSIKEEKQADIGMEALSRYAEKLLKERRGL